MGILSKYVSEPTFLRTIEEFYMSCIQIVETSNGVIHPVKYNEFKPVENAAFNDKNYFVMNDIRAVTFDNSPFFLLHRYTFHL